MTRPSPIPGRRARVLRRVQPAPRRARHHAGGRGRAPDPRRRRVLRQLAPGRIHVPHEDARPHSDNWQLLRSREGESAERRSCWTRTCSPQQTGFVEVGVREPSPDGACLPGRPTRAEPSTYELRIRDLRTGEDLPEVIAHSYPGVAWSRLPDYLFYLVPDELHRPFQVWRHQVGRPPTPTSSCSRSRISGSI